MRTDAHPRNDLTLSSDVVEGDASHEKEK